MFKHKEQENSENRLSSTHMPSQATRARRVQLVAQVATFLLLCSSAGLMLIGNAYWPKALLIGGLALVAVCVERYWAARNSLVLIKSLMERYANALLRLKEAKEDVVVISEAADMQLLEVEGHLERTKDHLAIANATVTRHSMELAEAKRDLVILEADLRVTRSARNTALADLEAERNTSSQLKTLVSRLESENHSLIGSLESINRMLKMKDGEIAELSTAKDKAELKASSLNAQLNELKHELASYEDTLQSLRAALKRNDWLKPANDLLDRLESIFKRVKLRFGD